MPLNNEIDTLNVHNLDNDIRDTATRNMIAPTENESYATNDYAKNQYLIWNDRKLYKATTNIAHGDTLTIGGNIRYIGTLSEEVYNLHVSSDEGIRELIANIEEANASKAYYFGDYIVLASDGLLYQVITNVSLGTAWAVGTNIQLVDNVAAVLTELKQGVHKTQQMLATVEATNKASKSYEIGEQFVFNNELVEVTQHIEQQGTITKGTNCKSSKSITDQFEDLRDDIANQDFQYVVWIGDSYTGAASLGDNIGQRYSTQVSASLGLIEKNYAVGGSSFVGGNRNYQLQTQDAINDFTNNNLDPTKVKYFIIGGTRNDGYINSAALSDYFAAVRQVLSDANYFSKAEIIIIPMMWDASTLPITYLETLNRLKEACVFGFGNRIRIIDGCYKWLSGRYNHILYQNGANVHPDVWGHYYIAKHVYSAIMGNSFGESSYAGYPRTVFSAGTSDQYFDIDKVGDEIHIHIQFTVTDVSQISNGWIIDYTYNDLNHFPELFFGNQRLWFNISDRNANSTQKPVIPVFLDPTISKTGDITGSSHLVMRAYNDALINNHTYFADIRIKNGVTECANIVS